MIKIKSISKRVLAVLLATLMLLTSGIVGTLAANVELAETGATAVRIYCEDNWNWNGLKIYYWGGSSPVSNWNSSPSMKDTGEKNGSNQKIYYYDVPTDVTGIIFRGNNGQQSVDITGTALKLTGGLCYYLVWNNKNDVSTYTYRHYTISAGNGGTISAPTTLTGIYTGDNAITITATPNSGYTFDKWSGDSGVANTSSVSTTFIPSKDNATVTANFKVDGYSYTVTAGEGGTVSPTSGTASSVEITATPNEGYKFAGWTTTNGSVASKTSASTTFTITSNNANATASFELEEYDLSLSQSPVSGTVKFEDEEFSSGTKKIKHNTEFTYEITAPENYVIDTLKVLGNEITEASGKASYRSSATPNAKGGSIDVTYKAVDRLVTVTLETTDDGTDGGTVEGVGYWAHGTTVTLTATPNEENFYEFDGWEFTSSEDTYSDASDLTVNRLTFTITGDVTVKATFKKQTTYNVTKATSIYEEPDSTDIPGTVQGDYIVVAGSEAILTAIAEPGFKFREWTIDGTIDKDQDLTSPSITIVPTSNVTVTAVFDRIPTHSITVNQSGYKDITGADLHYISLNDDKLFEADPTNTKVIEKIYEGEYTVTVNAPGYNYIKSFKVDGVDVTAEGKKAGTTEWTVKYKVNVNKDVVIDVEYSPNPTIIFECEIDGAKGDRVVSQYVDYNAPQTVTIPEKPGYYISGISGLGTNYDFENGTDETIRSKNITFSTVTESIKATVYYTSLPKFVVNVTADTTKGKVSPAVGAHEYEPNSEVTFTATPNTNYHTEWYVNGVKQAKGNTFKYTLTAKTTNVEAKFLPDQWDCVLFVKADNGWAKVNAYVWKTGTDSNLLGGWPGTAMELIDETNKIYAIYIDVPAEKIEEYSVVFNNGSAKTGNLTFKKGANMYTLKSGVWSYSDLEYTPTKFIYGVNGSTITRVDRPTYGNQVYRGDVTFPAQSSLSNIDNSNVYYAKAQWDGTNSVDIYTTVIHSDFKVEGWVINATKFVKATKTQVENEYRGTIPAAYLDEISNDAVAVYSHSEAWFNAHPDVQTVRLFADISQVSDITAYNWGEYISAYTWNEKDTTKGDEPQDGGYEQFGEWEGQIMIPAGDDKPGLYYAIVEKKGNGNYANDVMGITFTNFGGHSPCNNSVGFLQTYDYYEFIKLQDKDNIMFVLQPTDLTSNQDTVSKNYNNLTKTGSANNLDSFGTFADLKDYDGSIMDIYREPLTASEIEKNEVGLYVVRTGPYANNTTINSTTIDGQYYIDCFVYDSNKKFIGRCKSFELLDLESLAAKQPAFAVLTNEATKANFEGKIVKVAYEYPDYIKDNATRVDGEWYGVDNTKTITLTTRVARITENGYVVSQTNSEAYGTATIGGLAVWTGPMSDELVPGSITTSSDFKFVGWYHGTLDAQGNVVVDTSKGIISTFIDHKFTPYSNAYYVAVFEELAHGTFTVNNFSYEGNPDNPYAPPVFNKIGRDGSYRYVKIDKVNANGVVIEEGVKSDINTDSPWASTISVQEGDILKITIYTTPKYATDRVYAWYMEAPEADGTMNYEEVGTEVIGNFGAGEEATFSFTYVITENYQKNMIIYSDILTKTAEITLDYRYLNRYGNEKSYTKTYTLLGDELKNNRPSDDTIATYAPFVNDLYKDVTWQIKKCQVDSTGTRFILEATYNREIVVNVSVEGKSAGEIKGEFNEAYSLLATDYNSNVTNKGFWYVENGDDGVFTDGVDDILSYGTYYGLVFTKDMEINYVTTDNLDFKVVLNNPVYGREQANGVDKVYTDFIINYLVPYFSGDTVNGKEVFDVENKNAPIQLEVYAEAAGVTVEYGMIHQMINTFYPDADKNAENIKNYWNEAVALTDAQMKDYEDFLASGKSNASSAVSSDLFNYKYTGDNEDLTNKNRALMTFITNNTEFGRNSYFTAVAYLAIKDAKGNTTYYFSNVELFNIKEFVESNKGSDIVDNT